MLTRRQIRTKVMQACFACIESESDPTAIFHYWLEDDYNELKKKSADADDAEFLRNLYYDSLNNRREYEQILISKLENWDIERLASVDRALIILGVHEFLHFSEIPVKVTINEYIDLAKEYSAEKSSQFVNGMLDAISLYLLQENRIKKVGRGLLDPEKFDPNPPVPLPPMDDEDFGSDFEPEIPQDFEPDNLPITQPRLRTTREAEQNQTENAVPPKVKRARTRIQR